MADESLQYEDPDAESMAAEESMWSAVPPEMFNQVKVEVQNLLTTPVQNVIKEQGALWMLVQLCLIWLSIANCTSTVSCVCCFRWRKGIISRVENRPRSSRPARVRGGISEHSLLPVCLERRQDSLSASKAALCLSTNKMNCVLKPLSTLSRFSVLVLKKLELIVLWGCHQSQEKNVCIWCQIWQRSPSEEERVKVDENPEVENDGKAVYLHRK